MKMDLSSKLKGKKAAGRILKVLFIELVYALWIECNRRIFQGKEENAQSILRRVVQIAICRCIGHPKLALLCCSYDNYTTI